MAKNKQKNLSGDEKIKNFILQDKVIDISALKFL